MTAAAAIALAATREDVHRSADGVTTLDVRHAADADAVRGYDTEALRRRFLVQSMFRRDAIALTYSHVDRMVIGGALPVAKALALEALKPIGSPRFLDRRELGVLNIGGPGYVEVDGERYPLGKLDSLYVGMGAAEVRFASEGAADPARFYLVSAPAHAPQRTRKVGSDGARRLELGAPATANARTIYQAIHPTVMTSCQLVMGFTVLEPGSVWNTMPPHRHDRRCEVYFYFDLAPEARVLHLMGEPRETRHIVVANEEAVISPIWSIHSGVGTARYAFAWAMAGDNVDYTDMDAVGIGDLR
jgi:4-deoxy-L-threo-5-hexosulose-uronate ketol-isomerase